MVKKHKYDKYSPLSSRTPEVRCGSRGWMWEAGRGCGSQPTSEAHVLVRLAWFSLVQFSDFMWCFSRTKLHINKWDIYDKIVPKYINWVATKSHFQRQTRVPGLYTLLLQHESSHGKHVNRWEWLCSNKTMDTGI